MKQVSLKSGQNFRDEISMELDFPCDCEQSDRNDCEKCYGSGFCLTEDGKQLLIFLKRHFAKYEKLPIVPMKIKH